MRSFIYLGAVAALVALAGVHPAAARFCLPPLFDGGQRLHPLGQSQLLWLDPLLRQHELCWRDRPGEVRIVLIGNSAVYGYPLPVEQSFGALINARFTAEDVPAHVFNLGWVYTYQLRDTLILHEALAYQPDVIVAAMSLANLRHVAPTWFPALWRFFDVNGDALARMESDPPPGLAEPVQRYHPMLADRRLWWVAANRLQQLGALAQAGAHRHAEVVARALGAEPPPDSRPPSTAPAPYDCPKTLADNASDYRDFEQWNPLEDLADIRRRTGVEILVVNWPDAPDASGRCYNRRYGNALLAEYDRWLKAETDRLRLPYLNLRNLLPASSFVDSLHATADGHREIAERIGNALLPIVRARVDAEFPRGGTETPRGAEEVSGR